MRRLSEVQLLVLVSFSLQLFLFFTGRLRRRSRNWLLRGAIWTAYLGADMVAIYTLCFLSLRSLAHPLAFLWAPFLLIHLGGQDSITAFAMEDNSLWLRHLLNLLAQVTLALYVLCKSSSSTHLQLQVLVPGILLFVAGVIKCGEKTAALMHGDLNRVVINNNNNNNNNNRERQIIPPPSLVDRIYKDASSSAPWIRMLFASHKTPQVAGDLLEIVHSYYGHHPSSSSKQQPNHWALFKLMDVELAMVYSYLYTKAAVLRMKHSASGIVFRCISLACTAAALIFFFTISRNDDHGGGHRADTAISYALFIGVLAADICSVCTIMAASPAASRASWAWLHAAIARVSSPCLSSCCDDDDDDGRSSRPLWSNTMGQYRFVCYDDESMAWPPSSPSPWTISELATCIVKKLATCRKRRLSFSMSRLLETEQVAVDDGVTLCLVKEIADIAAIAAAQAADAVAEKQRWPCLGQLLLEATTQRPELAEDFLRLVSWLHACTEVLLRDAAAAAAAKGISIATGTAGAAASADVCRKLSRYVVYLVAAYPAAAAAGGGGSLLQVVSGDPEAEYQRCDERSWPPPPPAASGGGGERRQVACMRLLCNNGGAGSSSSSATTTMLSSTTRWPCSEMWQETLEELKHMWARLLVYAAARSRPEAHAAALARGGELVTFVWLLLAHYGLGDSSTTFRVAIDLVRRGGDHSHGGGFKSSSATTYYVFNNLPVQMVSCPHI